MAEKHGIPAQKIHIGTCEEAQNIPSASALFSISYNGKFITHEIMNESKFGKFVQILQSILRTVLISPLSIPPQAGGSTHETSFFSFPPVYGGIKGGHTKTVRTIVK
ncbi:MAG: YoaP domain-containing protein [Candidatus Vecturithrix sp.]|jgi:hypothetical protein|nr:YoaP domain-containing protein [Candidatus Vecturithrix sp.]